MSKRILVVDDEPNVLRSMERVLGAAGYDVITASDPTEALELLTAESTPVIFLDLNMPRLNGLELCRRIRSMDPISIIYSFTGCAQLFELHECRAAGFDDYLTKPVSSELLLEAARAGFEKIERWLREESAGESRSAAQAYRPWVE